MTTLKNMLDTMRITAGQLYSHDATGFDQRRKSGFGRFFDSTDVARLRPFETTRLLEGVTAFVSPAPVPICESSSER
jgi:hypothetical protein